MAEKKQVPKIAVSGQPVAVDRIINRVALKLELQRPAPEGFAPIIDGVVVDPERDTYPIQGSVVGFSAGFLARVMAAAGVRQVATEHRECEVDGQHGVEVEVVAQRPRAGEAPLEARAICRMSYEAAYEAYGAKGDRARAKEKTFLPRKLETMALNRCIAKLTGVPRAAKQSDLITDHGPIIMAFRRDQLNMADPEVRRAYIDSLAGATARLYGREPVNEHAASDPIDLGTDEQTITPSDTELDDVGEEEEAEWEDYDDEAEEEATEEEAEAEEPEDETFPTGWPFEEEHETSQRILNADTKRKMWNAVKDIDQATVSLFLSQWMMATSYPSEEDPFEVMKLWQQNKGLDAQRALCKLLLLHFNIEE